MKYEEIEGDLISLALSGQFDVIAHGCNCQCVMGAGLAPQMAKAFKCDYFDLEHSFQKGNINKLGQIDYNCYKLRNNEAVVCAKDFRVAQLSVVNAYTQYMYGTNHTDGVSKPLDYEALTLCLKKINHIFKGKHIGLPAIGTGLAGGVWDWTDTKTHMWSAIDLFKYQSGAKKDVKTIIKEELKDMNITVVHYKPN